MTRPSLTRRSISAKWKGPSSWLPTWTNQVGGAFSWMSLSRGHATKEWPQASQRRGRPKAVGSTVLVWPHVHWTGTALVMRGSFPVASVRSAVPR